MNDIEKAIEMIDKVWHPGKYLNEADNELHVDADELDKACELATIALEKQIPKKPFEYSYDESDGEDWYDEGYTYSCPICLNNGSEVGRYSKESEQWIFEMKEYCDNCGQRLEVEE